MHRPTASARRSALIPAALTTLALAALALLPLAGLTGCERAPTPPGWDNPFDPTGPDGGDPLGLYATLSGGSVTLGWRQPQGMGIVEYAISQAVHPDSTWSSLALVTQNTDTQNFYQVTDPTPTREHWYRVQALDSDGAASLSSYATPVGVTLGPRVILNQGTATIATRQLTVKVIVSRGTSLRVAQGPTYATETIHAAAAPGDTATIALDAGAAAQGDTVRVRVIATDGGAFTSVPTIAQARVDFSPDFSLKGGGAVASSRTVTLAVPPSGVAQMRFASSEAGLTGASWVPGAATHTQLLLSAATGAQQIWGEFAGDLGYNSISHITVTPDLLTAATFRLAVPENHVIETTAVRGILTGKAALLRWSEGPDLVSAPWIAHTDSLDIALTPTAGLKTIYLQMRNDWADSPILTDYAVLVARGVEVAFVAPAQGATLQSGVTLQVRGTAAGGAAALDSVKVDLGDGVFRSVTGTTSWSRMWSVPVVLANTPLTLRARAWSGVDSATTVLGVTVVP